MSTVNRAQDYAAALTGTLGVSGVAAMPQLPYSNAAVSAGNFKSGSLPFAGFNGNQELLMHLAAGNSALGRPTGGSPTAAATQGVDPAGVPANRKPSTETFYTPMLVAMFEQMLKRTSSPAKGAAPVSGTASAAPSRPSRLSASDKFYVVRELYASTSGASLEAAVESGPLDTLDEAYAVLQHIKSRHTPGEPQPEAAVLLKESTRVWTEPSFGPFFVVQLSAGWMAALQKAGRATSRRAAPAHPSRRHGHGAALGCAPGLMPLGGLLGDRCMSNGTSQGAKSEGAASPASSAHAAALDGDGLRAPRLAAVRHHSSRTGSQLTGTRGGREGPPMRLADAVDAAAGGGTTESPETSDYSVNRSYLGEGEAGAKEAMIQEDEELALAAIMDLKHINSGEPSRHVRGSPDGHGTPPSSDGTRAYLTSSDDEFNALKHPPKRRRSAYQPLAHGAPSLAGAVLDAALRA